MIIFSFYRRYSVPLCVCITNAEKVAFTHSDGRLIGLKKKIKEKFKWDPPKKKLLLGHLLTMDTLTFLSKQKWLK